MAKLSTLASTLGRTDGSNNPIKVRLPLTLFSLITCEMIELHPDPKGTETAFSSFVSYNVQATRPVKTSGVAKIVTLQPGLILSLYQPVRN